MPGSDVASMLLCASGTRGGASSRLARSHLDELLRWSRATCAGIPDERDRGLALFAGLWEGKPCRYQQGGAFRLHEVLEGQLRPGSGPVGNCLGLTILYNLLAEGAGLRTGAAFLDEAFGRGPHVFSLLSTDNDTIVVEHILRSGFNYPGHDLERAQRWGWRELRADVLASRASEALNDSRPVQALRLYEVALCLNPAHPVVHLNKGIALAALGRQSEAERVLGEECW